MTRKGKIARLPAAIREELNRRLLDGAQGRDLVQWLNQQPEVQAVLKAQFNGRPIGEMNLSRWRNGGCRSWQEEQRAMEAVTALLGRFAAPQEAAKNNPADRVT